MAIIDIHSHFLPGIDDGSRNAETSLAMLRESRRQGVELMTATPHFYADENRPEVFLKNRQGALEETLRAIADAHAEDQVPEIRIGAEVAFFGGIGRADRIAELTLEGTNLLLLEMPFGPWDDRVMSEVEELKKRQGLAVIYAHLERFLKFGKNKRYIREILEGPDYVQVNAGDFAGFTDWMRIGSWFKEERVDFLGSDAHGINHRPPNMQAGREILERKLGAEYLRKLDLRQAEILERHKVRV